MHILRRVGGRLAWSLFLALLFLFVLVSGLVLVLGNSAKVKGTIQRAGVYQSIIAGVLQQSQQSTSGDGSIGRVPLDRPEVQAALLRAFPPVLLQKQGESAIDSTYRWLENKDSYLNIRIDLTEAKTKFAANLGSYLTQRLSGLPRCPLSALPAVTFDAFNATCLPPGVDAGQASQAIEHAVSNSPDFLPNPVIVTKTVLNPNSSSTARTLHAAPAYYHRAKQLPFVLAVECVVLAAVAIGAAFDRRKAVRRLGISLLASGGFWIILAWLLDHIFQHFTSALTRPTGNSGSIILNNELAKVLNLTNTALNHEYFIFGAVLVVFGTLILLVIHFFWHQQKPAEVSQPLTSKSAEPPAVPSVDSSGKKLSEH